MHSFFCHSSLQLLFLIAIPICGTLFGTADKPRHWQGLVQGPTIPNGILAIPKDTLQLLFFGALFGALFGTAHKPRHWQGLVQSPKIPKGILAIPKDTPPGCGFTREGAVS